jgi:ABC-type polysaccharide/polyol phosphate transport system ATPase subunit
MPLIEFRNVSKAFNRGGDRILLRDYFGLFFQRHQKRAFYALRDVSFDVERGESVAVIGSNGAGKSTLLSLVAGLAQPDAGEVRVNGRVAALLELGVGFHPDLTGAENVRLNAALTGLSRARTREVFDDIVTFSGIADFIHEPLRAYSSGMVLRLAFSVAIHCDPEILLIDEVLVVGDQAFQAKCLEKVAELRRHGKTLLCVSHSAEMVRSLCDRAVWLDRGQVQMVGTAAAVQAAYTARNTPQPVGSGIAH